jgi:hypothetical protein
MADATPPVVPGPLELVAERWRDLEARAELACVTAWSTACRSWWLDEHDGRLRDRAEQELVLTRDELGVWHAQRLDASSLLRAHRHVIVMRAGLERDLSRRRLVTGALRTGGVYMTTRHGGIAFMPANQVAGAVDRMSAALDQLPSHPVLRAAWLSHAIGAIHPFGDGNGGTSRFLGSLELTRAWLPPLVLSAAQRRGPYPAAMIEADITRRIEPVAELIADLVHRSLATALMSAAGKRAVWDEAALARVARWSAIADRAVRARVGAAAIERLDATGPATIARLVRRGYQLAHEPAPRCMHWRIAAPLPVQLDLAVSPVRAGDATWLVAMVAGGVGDHGELGAVDLGDSAAPMLVAVDAEPDAVADARFARWIDARLTQYLRGLAHWL